MACLEMYNNSQPPPPPPMSPRISFSNDFVESKNSNNNSHHSYSSNKSELAPASTDFEFTITNFNKLTTSADELFFKGKLLPLPYKDNNNSQMQRCVNLRDQLLVNDDEGDIDFSLKPTKESCNKWKGFLSLRKSHIGSKKPEKLDVSTTFDSGSRFSFSLEDPNLAKSPQEMVSIEGSNSAGIEMGI